MKKLYAIIAIIAGLFTPAFTQFQNLLTHWPQTDGSTLSIVCDGNTIFIGGEFSKAGDQQRPSLAAIDRNSGKLKDWNPALPMSEVPVTTALARKDNILYAAVSGRILAFDAHTGEAVPGWNIVYTNRQINVLAVAGGVLFAGGNWDRVSYDAGFNGFFDRKALIALDTEDGTILPWDLSLNMDNPRTTPAVFTLEILGNTMFIGGCYDYIGGRPRKNLAAVEYSIGRVLRWGPDVNGKILHLKGYGDKLYVAGHYTLIGGVGRPGIASLDIGTGNISSWDPAQGQYSSRPGAVYSVSIFDNIVYAGGSFSSFAGTDRRYLVALDATTGEVADWNPKPSDSVNRVFMSDGFLYLGGWFVNTSGYLQRDHFAAFSNNPLSNGILAEVTGNGKHCAGESLTVSFDITGSYTSGNAFSVLLSDADGDFSSAVTIGSTNGESGAEVVCIIPAATPPGSGYMVMVVSTNPPVQSAVVNIEIAAPSTWYLDADDDGYYTGIGIVQCDSPGEQYKTNGLFGGGDCNDNEPNIHPGAMEVCGNGVDENCDGQVDEGCISITAEIEHTLCEGSSQGSISISIHGGTEPIEILWNNGSNSTEITGLRAGEYKVTVKDTYGSIAEGTYLIEAYMAAEVPETPEGIIGDQLVCPGVYTYTVLLADAAVSYRWTAPPFTSILSGQGTAEIELEIHNGYKNDLLKVVAENCLGASEEVVMEIKRARVPGRSPGTISGPSVICPGRYTFSVPEHIMMETFSWILPEHFVILSGQGTHTIEVDILQEFSQGRIAVQASNCAGTSSTQSKGIYKVRPPAKPDPIAGPTVICPGVFTYSIPELEGADYYIWLVPDNAEIISGNGTASVMIRFLDGYTTGTISVYGENCGGIGFDRKLIVGTIPPKPASINGPSTTVCGGSSGVTYSIVPVSDASYYKWTVNNGVEIKSGQGTTTVTLNFPSNFISAILNVVAYTSCGGYSHAQSLYIRSVPNNPLSISGPDMVCDEQSSYSYSIPQVVGAASYIWEVNNGAMIIAGQGSPTIQVSFPDGDQSQFALSVRAVNGCGQTTPSALLVNRCLSTRVKHLPQSDPGMPDKTALSSVLSVSVFPNPAKDRMTVELGTGMQDLASGQIRLYDLRGKLHMAIDLANNPDGRVVLDISGLAPQIYLMELVSGDFRHTVKIVKQ